jgi:sulfide:quinone oxidoreductase
MNADKSKEIVVLGGSFAGVTAAYDLKRELGDRHHITVIDKNDRFVFIPSLIWVPFGWRTPEQISFPLQPSLGRQGIDFLQATVERIDPEQRYIELGDGRTAGSRRMSYDYLVIATGPHVDFAAVEGLGPAGGHDFMW